MGERANQSGNFSTRIEAAEFRKRFDEFSKFSRQKKEEISFGTKQERREITVACKRKEAYVSSTGRRAPLRWRKHDLNTLISLARRRERTNVVIHLWEEDFTPILSHSLSLCNKKPAGFALTATHAMLVLRISEPRLSSDRWPMDTKSPLPSSPFDDLKSTQIQLLLLKFLLRRNTVFQWFQWFSPEISLSGKIVRGRGRRRKQPLLRGRGKKELFLSLSLARGGDLRVISMAAGV